MEKIYNITCGTDDKYAQHCLAMLCSLFDSNKDKHIIVHILINKLSDSYKNDINKLSQKYSNEVIYHVVDDNQFEGVKFKAKRPLTKAAYYRLKLPTILGNVNTVLYLDCDMIVLGDIDELFNIDLNGYALAACKDPMPYNNLHRRQLNHPVGTNTFCSGIMYINLNYWREKNVEPICMEFAKRDRNPVYLHDQDVFNYVFRNKWYMLPPKWNVSPNRNIVDDNSYKDYDYNDYEIAPAIYHYYDSIKPWQNLICRKKKLYRKYLKLSGCTNIVIEKKPWSKQIKAVWRYIEICYECDVEPLLPWTVKFIMHEFLWFYHFPVYIIKKVFFNKRNRYKQIGFFKYNKLG